MRHVTDGELHAYLDGALDHLPMGRAEEVREHLNGCSACAERLQDEEKVRADANDLLGLALSEEMAIPPFEELRARAEAAPKSDDADAGDQAAPVRYRGPLRGVPLAWAATVVLARGVGWMGGGVWRTSPGDVVDSRPSSEPRVQPASLQESIQEPTSDAAGAAREEAQEDESMRTLGSYTSTPTAAQDVAVAPSGVAFADATGGGSGVEAESQIQPSVVAGVEERDEPSVDPVSEDVVSRRRTSMSFSDVRSDVPARAPAESLLEPPRLSRSFLDEVSPIPGDSMTISDGNALAVPGLRVLSVGWEEWNPREQALHIRQLLPAGDTLELRYLGLLMGADPNPNWKAADAGVEAEELASPRSLSPSVLEASLPPGWNQVVMHWGRAWLVARAPLPESALKALLRSLHK